MMAGKELSLSYSQLRYLFISNKISSCAFRVFFTLLSDTDNTGNWQPPHARKMI